jgi:glycosyltransferase involved in cell wall biosynthesis
MAEVANKRRQSSATYHVVLAVRSDSFAGVERYITVVANCLIERGHRVTLIGGHHERVQALVPDAHAIAATSLVDVTRALARHARRADVVHVHMTAAEIAAMLTRPALRGAVVSTLHFASPRGSSPPVRALSPLIRKSLDGQIAISEFVRMKSGERAVVLLNGVPNRAAVDAATPRVLVAQRLEAEKQTVDALHAWALADLAAQGWELVVAGDGAERPRLERTVRESRIAGVRFVGQSDDVDALRRESAMQLAPAPAEPFGLSVVEAMASALPVIAADGGGHRETLGQCRGDQLYPPGDAHACAAIMCRLAASTELRRQIGAELQEYQQRRLSDQTHVDALVAHYDELMDQRS